MKQSKKIIAIILTLCMMLSMMPVMAADVTDTIEHADTQQQPDVTGNADDADSAGNADNAGNADSSTFTDVAAGEWYASAVQWAANNGIVVGYTNGSYGPHDNITRSQAALILMNYARLKNCDLTATGDLAKFTDKDQIQDWARTALQWAVGQGLIGGSSDGSLNPNGTATRAEMATMIRNYLELVAK